MKSNNNNSKTTISTKKMIFFTVLWVFTIVTFTLLMTNFFTETPFQNEYIAFYISIFVATIGIARLYSVYRKSQKLSGTE